MGREWLGRETTERCKDKMPPGQRVQPLPPDGVSNQAQKGKPFSPYMPTCTASHSCSADAELHIYLVLIFTRLLPPFSHKTPDV